MSAARVVKCLATVPVGWPGYPCVRASRMARYLRRLSLMVCSFWTGRAFQRVYDEPTSEVGCLKVASRAQFSCPGFGPREPHSTPQYLGQLMGFSAEVLSSRGDQKSRHFWQLSHGPPC